VVAACFSFKSTILSTFQLAFCRGWHSGSGFVWVLQIEKIVLFMIEKQGLLAGRLQKLRERRHIIQDGESYTDNDTEQAVSEPPEEFDTVQRLMSEYRYTYQAWNER
jgi:hypothetical protein